MLGNWCSHADYQKFMIDSVNKNFKYNPKSIKHFESALLKLYYLNLDVVKEDFLPFFSITGRPANQQPEIFRSFILMSHFLYASIEKWVEYAVSNPIICALVGVTPDDFPGVSTHYDFFNRLWCAKKPDKQRVVKKKPKDKHGKNKLPNKRSGVVKFMVDKALSGEIFKKIPERLFQALFTKTALIPSANLGLLGNTNKLIISADGTCIESNANSFGHKTCSCTEKCDCPRSFADPEAKWGWDSYHERYFYGYTGYFLSTYNKNLKLDLPIYLKLSKPRVTTACLSLLHLPMQDFYIEIFCCLTAF